MIYSKKRILSISICFAFLFTFKHAEAQTLNISETITGYFEASKNGNVEEIKNYIAGRFYEKRRTLLEKNKDYPSYLRKQYEGIEIQLIDIVIGGPQIFKGNPKLSKRYYRLKKSRQQTNLNSVDYNNFAVGIIRYHHPEGNSYNAKILLREVESESWKIIDEIRIK